MRSYWCLGTLFWVAAAVLVARDSLRDRGAGGQRRPPEAQQRRAQELESSPDETQQLLAQVAEVQRQLDSLGAGAAAALGHQVAPATESGSTRQLLPSGRKAWHPRGARQADPARTDRRAIPSAHQPGPGTKALPHTSLAAVQTRARQEGGDHNAMELHTGEGKKNYPPKPRSKVKGNARPELLFDLRESCDARMDYVPPARLCLGVGQNRQIAKTCPDNTVERGSFDALPRVGGPTGCHQAWMTVQGDDSFLAATLVLLHTVRKFSQEDRDFVVIASTAVTQPVLDVLLAECVRVIQVDPFDGNDMAKQLVAKSERYKSGYWLLKMYVWRLMEYSKVVFLDGDIYFRHNPDALFCAPTPPRKAPVAVTPRSSFNPTAGFNAGMFVFNPSRDIFKGILDKFLGLSEEQMLATSEQDFLNEFFKGRYNLVPVDFVCKHRRMVNEGLKKWDLTRVHGYHMNGNPKPWNPTWRTGCAYPDEHAAKVGKYVDFFREWWSFYYDMIGMPVPYDVSQYRLLPEHDLYKVRWATWDPATFTCPKALKGISNKG